MYMLPLAGRTVIALYPNNPIYCSCQIRYLYGCSRCFTCSRGSMLHKGAIVINLACSFIKKGLNRTFYIVALDAATASHDISTDSHI